MDLLLFLYYVVLISCIAVGAFLWNTLDTFGKVLLVTVSGIFLLEAFSKILSETSHFNPRFYVSSLTTFVEIAGYTTLFLITNEKKNILKTTLIVVFSWAILSFLHWAYFDFVAITPLYLFALESLLFTIYALITLYFLADSSIHQNFFQDPRFIIWSLILLYYSVTFAFWFSLRLLYAPTDAFSDILIKINIIFAIILYLGIGMSFFLYTRKNKLTWTN